MDIFVRVWVRVRVRSEDEMIKMEAKRVRARLRVRVRVRGEDERAKTEAKRVRVRLRIRYEWVKMEAERLSVRLRAVLISNDHVQVC